MNHIKYEDALQELQQILQQLQEEQISVDELSGQINRAAELIAFCRAKLRSTEESIQGLFDEKV